MSNIVFKQCNSTNYQPGRTKPIKYIVIHFTANDGDTAKNNIDYFANNKNLSASAHYFVDEYDVVYQSVRDSDTAWHCGGSSVYKHPECRNANSIGIEMCSRIDNDGRYYFKNETVNNAVRLTKELMAEYNIPVENVIRHFDVWAKICPDPFVRDDNKWKDFKNKLSGNGDELTVTQYEELKNLITELTKSVNDISERVSAMEKPMVYNYVDANMPEWARSTVQKLVDKGYLKGDESGLNLNEDLLRTFVVLDRAGMLS